MKQKILTLEALSPERITELWPQLAPLLDAACESNEISAGEMNSTDLYIAAQSGDAGIIVVLEEDEPLLVLGVQFVEIFGRQGVEILAMGGRQLMKAKAALWHHLLQWFRDQGLTFVDAYANDRMAELYRKKFGFTKSCQHVRMML